MHGMADPDAFFVRARRRASYAWEFQMTLTATLAIACALLLLGRYLNGMASAQHARRLSELRRLALQEDLQILRLLQQHRGLAALHELPAVALRHALAAELGQRLQQRGALPDPPAVASGWARLRDRPADFDGHCALIEKLIAAIESRQPLGQACRELEALARLRGLCVIAASQQACPPGVQARLNRLCRRLSHEPHGELQRLLGRLQRELIDAPRPGLSAPQCFALLTPFIDARLQSIQHRLQHEGAQALHGPG